MDLRFIVLGVLTLLFSSRLTIEIPQFRSKISVSDTFIFLTLLLYGWQAAVLLAAAEALVSSFQFARKPITILFNWACASWSAAVTYYAIYFFVGDAVALNLGPISAKFIAGIAIMALAQYVSNSGIVAICGALQANKPIWETWKKHYLWTSITYFAGASAAALIAKLIGQLGLYALVVTIPIVAIVFFTYRTYLKNIEAAAAQAEQAERHVEELSHYIAEQDRIREQFRRWKNFQPWASWHRAWLTISTIPSPVFSDARSLSLAHDPEKIERGLNIIIKCAEDGAKTVKRIQDFARQSAATTILNQVCIDQMLLDVSEITRPRWKDRAEASNVQIGLDLQIRSKATVMGDESELREVLVNIVLNAVDAMPEGGQLTLAAEDVDGAVVVSVGDTGSGMAPEVKSRIFDPFFTTKGKAGMGLGLAVSFGIIRRHEGSVEVESEVGVGTRFRISLPRAVVSEDAVLLESKIEKPVLEAASGDIARPRNENQAKILVVDDEEAVRELLRDLLEAEDCRVYLAQDGREALGFFEVHQFDGIFTDVGMPGMSGWELAHAIRQRDEKVPIAVITGWGSAVGSDEQKEARVNWVITKPFRAERISELAHEISQQRNAASKRALLTTVAA